jgi:peptide/nickel transport system permease protein
MLGFLLARAIRAALVVLTAMLVGFALVTALPGERLTVSSTTESRSGSARGARETQAPATSTWLSYVARLGQGDLGQATSEPRPVRTLLAEALPATLWLALPAFVLATLVGVGGGSLLGWYSQSRAGQLAAGALLVLYTLPDVVLGTLALTLLAGVWPLLPAGGLADPRVALLGTPVEQAVDRLRHLVLPTLVLALSWSPALFRQQQRAMARLQRAPSLQVARAKGVRERTLLWIHALPQASLGALALLGALLPTLVGGAVVVETLFAWPGMGRLMVYAVAMRDAPLLAGGLLCIAAAVAFGSLLTSALARWLDPRLRTDARDPVPGRIAA